MQRRASTLLRQGTSIGRHNTDRDPRFNSEVVRSSNGPVGDRKFKLRFCPREAVPASPRSSSCLTTFEQTTEHRRPPKTTPPLR